jgi:hypothetical protein
MKLPLHHRGALCGLFVAALASCAMLPPLHAGERPAARPEGRKNVSTGPLKLNDADFWSDPRRTRGEIEGPLLDAGRDALLFDAPTVVPIDVQATAPTQALRAARLSTLREWPFREHAIVVGVDLTNNMVQAALAVEPPNRPVPPAAPASDRPAQPGMGSETFTIDLRQRLELPWEPGHVLARLIVGDQVTPARVLELKTTSKHVDPEVERFRAEQRLKTRVPALSPAPDGPGVSYLRDERTPPLPADVGLALTAPRVCVMGAGTPCTLRGSFRLPVLKRHIVPAGAMPGAEALRQQWAAWAANGQRLPAAVVPITLIGANASYGGPAVWRLVVPVFEALDFKGPQPIGVGSFSLDLRTLAGFADEEQSWFVYGFSDEAFSGPLPVGLTRRPRTP